MIKVRQGGTLRLVHWYADNGVLYTPTSPVVSIYTKAGVLLKNSSDVELSDKALTKISTGYYYYEFTLKSDAEIDSGYYAVFSATGDARFIGKSPEVSLFEVISASAIPYYADWDKAASMGGVATYEILESWASFVDDVITSKAGGKIFGQATPVDEYVDIRNHGQKTLTLKHFPVVEVTEVENDAQSADPHLLSFAQAGEATEDIEVIWFPHGRMEFINAGYSAETVGESGWSHFKMGRGSVRVSYSYGYVAIPDLIRRAATALLARIVIIYKKESDAETSLTGIPFLSVTSIRVADFALNFDSGVERFSTKYDNEVQDLLRQVERTYKNQVVFG
jgi:hypothetical protein